jgi:hypothetical protein
MVCRGNVQGVFGENNMVWRAVFIPTSITLHSIDLEMLEFWFEGAGSSLRVLETWLGWQE